MKKRLKTSNCSKKKALCIASVASNLDNFNRGNVEILRELGYEVTLAANFCTQEETNSQEKINEFAREMRAKGVHIVQVDFSRRLSKISLQMKSVMQVKKLLRKRFDLIHCHSPICAAIVRVEAEKYRKIYGTKVFYTAHGFHFFNGAPKKNWLIFYPIEKLLSCYTDILITINHEDYMRAKRDFHAKRTVYIPGVGIDLERYNGELENREEIRRKIGIKKTDVMLLSVGELNKNKNHELAIKTLSMLREEKPKEFERIQYFVCGQGNLREELKQLVQSMELEKHVHFLGYQNDIVNFYTAADIFIFTSKREGLPMALMEAMAYGLPVICTRIRGNADLVRNGQEGYLTSFDADEIKKILQVLLENTKLRDDLGKKARERIQKYDKRNVAEKMKELYCSNRIF